MILDRGAERVFRRGVTPLLSVNQSSYRRMVIYLEIEGNRRPINNIRSRKAATPAQRGGHTMECNAEKEGCAVQGRRLGAIIYCSGKSKTDWLGKAEAGEDVSQVRSHLAHGRCIVSSPLR
jgi:hypothetical protein